MKQMHVTNKLSGQWHTFAGRIKKIFSGKTLYNKTHNIIKKKWDFDQPYFIPIRVYFLGDYWVQFHLYFNNFVIPVRANSFPGFCFTHCKKSSFCSGWNNSKKASPLTGYFITTVCLFPFSGQKMWYKANRPYPTAKAFRSFA